MKYVYLLLLGVLTTSLAASARTQPRRMADSLLSVLPGLKNDTGQVKLLDKLARHYREQHWPGGTQLGLQALELASRLQWKKGEASAGYILGACLVDESRYEEALIRYQAALAAALQSGDGKLSSDCYNALGVVQTYLMHYDEALVNYFRALAIKRSIGDREGLSTTCNNMGAVYSDQGNYPEALKYYFAALKLDLVLHNVKKEARDYRNLEIIYELQGNYPEALKNNFTSLKLCRQINDQPGIAASYQHLANVYGTLGDHSRALSYDSAALKINKNLGDKRATAALLTQLGRTYTSTQDYPRALKSLFAALELYTAMGTPDGTVYSMIGDVYNKQGHYREAERYAVRALEIARRQGSPETVSNANEVLTSTYENTGRFRQALAAYREFIKARDSIGNIHNAQKLVRLQDQYNFDVREAAMQADHKRQLEVAAVSSKARLRLWLIAGAAVLAVGGTGFLFYNKHRSARFNLQLTRARLEALNAQMNDHFIGNTMDSINHFIRNNDKEKASEYLILFSRLIRQVLENASETLIPLKDDLDILKAYIELEQLRFPDGKLKYEINVDREIDMENTLIPPRVFQVLAENSIKHGFKKSVGGNLLIRIVRKDECLECALEDNGMGRRKAAPGTAEKGRTSLGGSLAEKLVKTGNRNFKKESFKIIDLLDEARTPIGTRVLFSLPIVSDHL